MSKNTVATIVALLGASFFAGAAPVPGVPEAAALWAGREGKIVPVPVQDVRFEGGFWGPKMRIYKERTIPHSWKYMAHDIRSLRKAAGEGLHVIATHWR